MNLSEAKIKQCNENKDHKKSKFTHFLIYQFYAFLVYTDFYPFSGCVLQCVWGGY